MRARAAGMLVALTVTLAGIPGAPAAAAASAPPVPPAAVPPDLGALEQKMLALQLTSERFSLSVSVAGKPGVKGLGGGGVEQIFGRSSRVAGAVRAAALQIVPFLTASGEASFVPPAMSVEMSLLGLKVDMRLVGTTLYTQDPLIAGLDGGRPWVEERGQTLAKALGSTSPLPGSPGPPAQPRAGYAGLVQAIASARSIAEVGSATVDDQATRRFKLSIPLAPLEQRAKSQPHAAERMLRKLFDPLARVELYIAEDGLPVRTTVVIGVRHGGELIVQSDVPAVDIPVSVVAPPAAQTISKATLERLMAKRAKLRKRHGKIVGRRGSGAPKSKK